MIKLIGKMFFGLGVICLSLVVAYASFLEIEELGVMVGSLLLAGCIFVLIGGLILFPIEQEEKRCGQCHQIIPNSMFNIGCPNCDRH